MHGRQNTPPWEADTDGDGDDVSFGPEPHLRGGRARVECAVNDESRPSEAAPVFLPVTLNDNSVAPERVLSPDEVTSRLRDRSPALTPPHERAFRRLPLWWTRELRAAVALGVIWALLAGLLILVIQ